MHDDDLMTPSDEFDAKACRLTANKLTSGWMPINDVGYHLFEQGLSKDLSKPALSVCIANPLFGSLVWVVLPRQARSTGGRAIIKPHKRLVKSPLGAVVCTLQAPDDDEYDPVKQRVHTEELEPPAHVESTPTAFTTCLLYTSDAADE